MDNTKKVLKETQLSGWASPMNAITVGRTGYNVSQKARSKGPSDANHTGQDAMLNQGIFQSPNDPRYNQAPPIFPFPLENMDEQLVKIYDTLITLQTLIKAAIHDNPTIGREVHKLLVKFYKKSKKMQITTTLMYRELNKLLM